LAQLKACVRQHPNLVTASRAAVKDTSQASDYAFLRIWTAALSQQKEFRKSLSHFGSVPLLLPAIENACTSGQLKALFVETGKLQTSTGLQPAVRVSVDLGNQRMAAFLKSIALAELGQLSNIEYVADIVEAFFALMVLWEFAQKEGAAKGTWPLASKIAGVIIRTMQHCMTHESTPTPEMDADDVAALFVDEPDNTAEAFKAAASPNGKAEQEAKDRRRESSPSQQTPKRKREASPSRSPCSRSSDSSSDSRSKPRKTRHGKHKHKQSKDKKRAKREKKSRRSPSYRRRRDGSRSRSPLPLNSPTTKPSASFDLPAVVSKLTEMSKTTSRLATDVTQLMKHLTSGIALKVPGTPEGMVPGSPRGGDVKSKAEPADHCSILETPPDDFASHDEFEQFRSIFGDESLWKGTEADLMRLVRQGPADVQHGFELPKELGAPILKSLRIGEPHSPGKLCGFWVPLHRVTRMMKLEIIAQSIKVPDNFKHLDATIHFLAHWWDVHAKEYAYQLLAFPAASSSGYMEVYVNVTSRKSKALTPSGEVTPKTWASSSWGSGSAWNSQTWHNK
jgi:hypothetical protein